jgi:hypothetical protein
VSWLLTALRHQRARKSDLMICEACYDALEAELGDAAGEASAPARA